MVIHTKVKVLEKTPPAPSTFSTGLGDCHSTAPWAPKLKDLGFQGLERAVFLFPKWIFCLNCKKHQTLSSWENLWKGNHICLSRNLPRGRTEDFRDSEAPRRKKSRQLMVLQIRSAQLIARLTTCQPVDGWIPGMYKPLHRTGATGSKRRQQ